MKTILNKITIALLLLIASATKLYAGGPPPPPPPPPGGGPPCFPPPCIPINGGIQYLVIIGFIIAIYAAIKIRKQERYKAY